MGGDGLTLHVEVHEGQGPHLLLVHGMYSGRSHWLPNLEGLSAFTRPVVIEMLGHGRSPSPDDLEHYHPRWYGEEFERIRASLGAERWLVCGQSLGAAVTLRYALDYPERVAAQAFTNSATVAADAAWGERIRAGAHARPATGEEEGREAIWASRLNPANNSRLSEQLRSALAADVALHSPKGIRLTSLGTLTHGSVRERLASNLVPTLLVVGRFERAFEENRRWIEAHMSNLEVVELDAGHGVNLDAPDGFNAALRAFFAKHVPEMQATA